MSDELEPIQLTDEAVPALVLTPAWLEQFSQAVAVYQRYLQLCLRLTTEQDWIATASGGGPVRYYLQSSGAEKLCSPFGIVWDQPVVIRHDRGDGAYEYEVHGIMTSRLLRRHGWFTGSASSRDPFFANRTVTDEGDVRKAAFSNWLVNGVTRLIGLRNPSEPLLVQAGLAPDQIRRIDYGRRRPAPAAEVQATPTVTTVPPAAESAAPLTASPSSPGFAEEYVAQLVARHRERLQAAASVEALREAWADAVRDWPVIPVAERPKLVALKDERKQALTTPAGSRRAKAVEPATAAPAADELPL